MWFHSSFSQNKLVCCGLGLPLTSTCTFPPTPISSPLLSVLAWAVDEAGQLPTCSRKEWQRCCISAAPQKWNTHPARSSGSLWPALIKSMCLNRKELSAVLHLQGWRVGKILLSIFPSSTKFYTLSVLGQNSLICGCTNCTMGLSGHLIL